MSWLTEDAELTGRWKHTAAGTSSPVAPVYGDGDEQRTQETSLKLAFVGACEEEPSHRWSFTPEVTWLTFTIISLPDETCDESWNLSGSLFFIRSVFSSPVLSSLLVISSLLSVIFFSQITSLHFSISVLARLTWRHPDVPDASRVSHLYHPKGRSAYFLVLMKRSTIPLALPGPSLRFYVRFLHSWNQTVCSRLWLSGFNEPPHDYYDAQQKWVHESIMKVTVRCSLPRLVIN